MPKFVLAHAQVSVNNVDLTDHCSSVTLEDTADEVDFTAFCSDYREFGQGLKDATITCTFFSDFDAGEVDATLEPLYRTGGTFPVVIRAGSEPVSGSNPSYTMTSRMFSYSPISGAVGEASTTDVAFRNAGSLGLVRGTS